MADRLIIVQSGNNLKVTGQDGIPVFTPLRAITRVSGFYQENASFGQSIVSQTADARRPESYKQQTQVTIELNNGKSFVFEADDVTNQTTWQGKTSQSLTAALSDIAAMLP